MSIKKVSVVLPNGEHTIMSSRPKAVRAVITVRRQVMKHVTVVRQDAREQSVKLTLTHRQFIARKFYSLRPTFHSSRHDVTCRAWQTVSVLQKT